MENNSDGTIKKVDPGWNDPPMLNYTASNPPPKSRITNKRVAFPLNTTPNNSLKSHISSISPPPLLMNLTPKNVDSQDISSDELFNRLSKNLEKLLKANNDINITNKICILKEMWNEGKFNLELQKRILDLTSLTVEHRVAEANELEADLMKKQSNICESWMPAIRHFINNPVL